MHPTIGTSPLGATILFSVVQGICYPRKNLSFEEVMQTTTINVMTEGLSRRETKKRRLLKW